MSGVAEKTVIILFSQQLKNLHIIVGQVVSLEPEL